MTHLIHSLSQPLLQTLLATLVLILMVLALRRTVSKYLGADIAYWLWAIPFARLALGGLTSPVSVWSLTNRFEPTGPAESVVAPEIMFAVAPAGTDAQVAPMVFDVQKQGAFSDINWPLLLVGLWAAGVAIMLAKSLYEQWQFRQTLKREALPVSPALETRARQLSERIGLKKDIRLTASLISACPFVENAVRPVICVPAWFEDTTSRDNQDIALAHEMMHIKRGDLIALQACNLIATVFWFVPFKQIAIEAFRTDQEAACDADVLKAMDIAPYTYGSTLVEAVRQTLPNNRHLAHSLTLNHSLKERLKIMSHPKPTTPVRRAGVASVALVALGSLIFSATAGEDEKKERTSLTIEDSHFIVNGEEVEGQKFILLGNPFDIPEPPGLQDKIDELTAGIDADVKIIELELSSLEDMPEPPIPPLPPGATEVSKEHVIIHRMDAEDLDEETRAKWKEWEKKVEEHAKRIEERHASVNEEKIRAMEVRIERRAQELEHHIEATYGKDFEAKMNKVGKSVEKLALQCKDSSQAGNGAEVLSGDEIDGKRIRAVCLKADDTIDERLKALIASGKLTDAEADQVKSQMTGTHRYTFITD